MLAPQRICQAERWAGGRRLLPAVGARMRCGGRGRCSSEHPASPLLEVFHLRGGRPGVPVSPKTVPFEAGEFWWTQRHSDSGRGHSASRERPGGSGRPGSAHLGDSIWPPSGGRPACPCGRPQAPVSRGGRSVAVGCVWGRLPWQCWLNRWAGGKGPSHCRSWLLGGSPGARLSRGGCRVRSVPPALAEAVGDLPALSDP